MRHLGSIVLAVILAPVIYIFTGYGMVRLQAGSIGSNGLGPARGLNTNWTDVGIGAGALAVAGALYAVLVLTRLSPLGPFIAALSFLGIQIWAVLTDQGKIMDTLGTSVLGIRGAAESPLPGGIMLLLAIPLLATIFSPRRWRGKDKLAVATPGYAPPVGQSTHPQATPDESTSTLPAPAFGEPDSAHTYVPSETPNYPPPSAPMTYAETNYTSPNYPTPSSAGPAYSPLPETESTKPQHAAAEPAQPAESAPQQTSPDSAKDARSDEPTVIDRP